MHLEQGAGGAGGGGDDVRRKRAARRRKRNCIDTIIDGSFMGMVLAVCLAMVLGSAFFAYKGGESRICNKMYFGGLSDPKKPTTGTIRMEQDRLQSVAAACDKSFLTIFC